MRKEFLADLYARENETRDYIYQRANLVLVVTAGCITMNGYVVQRIFFSDLWVSWWFGLPFGLGVLLTLRSIYSVVFAIGRHNHAHPPSFAELEKRRQIWTKYNEDIFRFNIENGRFVAREDVEVLVDRDYCRLVSHAIDVNKASNERRIWAYQAALNFSGLAVIVSSAAFAIFSLGNVNRDSPISPKLIWDKDVAENIKKLNNTLESFYGNH